MGNKRSIPRFPSRSSLGTIGDDYIALIDHKAGVIRKKYPQHQMNIIRSAEYRLSVQVGKLQSDLELGCLRELLSEWRHCEEEGPKAAIVYRIQRKYVHDKVLLVSDMSGFTRVSKEEGIIHFLTLIKQMQAMCLPIVEHWCGSLIKVVADNLFCVFDDPCKAIQAALQMKQYTDKWSEDCSRNDRISLSIGLAMGNLWVLPGVDVFGKTADVAFNMGENIASKEILIDANMYEVVRHSDKFHDWSFKCREEIISNDIYTVFRVEPSKTWCQTAIRKTPSAGDSDTIWRPGLPYFSFVHPQINHIEPLRFLSLINERILSVGKKNRLLIDKRIKEVFSEHRAVLVLESRLEPSSGNEDHDISSAEVSMLDSIMFFKKICSQEVSANKGMEIQSGANQMISQVFALFPSVDWAFQAAVVCKNSLEEECPRLAKNLAWGICYGEILDFDATNAFGDAVNVSFKLGEDIANNGDFLISDIAFQELGPNITSEFQFEQRTESLSGVTIKFHALKSDHCDATSFVMKSRQNRGASFIGGVPQSNVKRMQTSLNPLSVLRSMPVDDNFSYLVEVPADSSANSFPESDVVELEGVQCVETAQGV